jgi:hypothetical protein
MRLTCAQRSYLDYLMKNKILRGRGANQPCHKLRLMGLATVNWIGPREYAYTITRKGEEVARTMEKPS